MADQPQITELVMEAMGETGPFVMMGNMDGGDMRAYQFALDHPDKVVAVVPVVMSQVGEFTAYGTYFDWSDDKINQYAKYMLSSRVLFANIINFFGVCWGLISVIVPPSADYRPKKYAYESTFLNIYNERQWVTNTNIIYAASKDPQASNYLFVGESVWLTNSSLSSAIPVLSYDLYVSDKDLYDTCDSMQFSHSSSDCQFYFYLYNQTISNYNAIIARNPSKNTLTLCTNCTTPGNNAFLIDQDTNIEWFVDSLMQQIGSITV